MKEVLFITEGGVGVVDGNLICYGVYEGQFKIIKNTAWYLSKFAVKSLKFYTETAALNYCMDNIPLSFLTLKDFKQFLSEEGQEVIKKIYMNQL